MPEARRVGARRRGIDGAEHSSTLEGVMAGDHKPPCVHVVNLPDSGPLGRLVRGETQLEIASTIAYLRASLLVRRHARCLLSGDVQAVT
jgi:hypothetical protein